MERKDKRIAAAKKASLLQAKGERISTLCEFVARTL
jgi:hypothetical protein